MVTNTFQKILANLSNNPNVQKLVQNFGDLSVELKKREAELKKAFNQEKDEKIALALEKYQELIKTLNSAEKKLEKEVNVTISQIKKSATSVEKNIVAYRKKAKAKAAKIEKALVALQKKQASKAKKASKKTTKKASTARKTTKKVATKKAAN